MPAGSPQAPILSCGASEQLAGLRRALAPQRWPLDPGLLPADALLVGGAVRDALLGRLGERPDLDLVVNEDAVALARSLARRCGGSCVVLDAERSIARLVVRGWSFDLARRMGASLGQDLGRRDYSVNAIALPLKALAMTGSDLPPQGQADTAEAVAGRDGDPATWAPIDPTGGLADLRARRLRALAEANLLEDPLRLLRGVRLACELGFTIEPRTLGWIQEHHQRLGEVAGERVLSELERLAATAAGNDGLRQVQALGLLEGWRGEPQALRRLDAGSRPETGADAAAAGEAQRWLARLSAERAERCGLRAEEGAWALPLARLAALLTPAALQQLRASRRLQQRCPRLRHWLQRLERDADLAPTADGRDADDLTLSGLPEAERFALQRELEQDLPALALHLEPSSASEALARWRDGGDPLFHPRPPLDGQQLQQLLGIPAGRQLGALLDQLSRERAFGRLAADAGPEAVLQTARLWLSRCRTDAAAPPSTGQAT